MQDSKGVRGGDNVWVSNPNITHEGSALPVVSMKFQRNTLNASLSKLVPDTILKLIVTHDMHPTTVSLASVSLH